MEWKDLEKMTVLKLREEALKFPQIEGVHGKNKEQLMDEIAKALGIEKPQGAAADRRSLAVDDEEGAAPVGYFLGIQVKVVAPGSE